MKLICRDFETIYFEIRSLFFCLMKRTKNQGFGIVVKAQISNFFEDFRSEALYFVHSWNAYFVGDLLRSYLQKFNISVRDQNPTIPRPNGWFWIGSYDLWMKLICLKFEMIYLKWNLCSFPWWKEPKIKAADSYELGVMVYEWN